jgi:hypothetical protein
MGRLWLRPMQLGIIGLVKRDTVPRYPCGEGRLAVIR